MAGEFRFAVGSPDGMSSNSFKVWTHKETDKKTMSLYIKGRDSFKELEVSLHASGRWRMGLTAESLVASPGIRRLDQNRAWEVWDKPQEQLPKTTMAFRIVFHPSSIYLKPQDRKVDIWKKNILFVEAPPPGCLTIATIFITNGLQNLTHEVSTTHTATHFEIGEDLYAQLTFHGERDNDFSAMLSSSILAAKAEALKEGVNVTPESSFYFFGKSDDGVRFITFSSAGG